MTASVEVLVRDLGFPEGPAFDPNGALWCVDLLGRELIEISPRGRIGRHPAEGVPNGLAFDREGSVWFCDSERNAVRRFDPATGEWRTVSQSLDGAPLSSPNDLAFDAAGNVIFTCPGGSQHHPVGYACCLKPDGTITTIAAGMYFPNGLAFVEDGRALVVAETHRQRLWKGGWVDPKPWASVGGPTGPDGMALGADGRLYVAVFGSGTVKAVDTRGAVAEVFRLPGKNPTNVAFDPSGDLGLVVTEAQRGELLSLPNIGMGAALFG